MTSVLSAVHAVMAEVTSVSKDDQYNGGQTRFAYRGVDRVVRAISASMRKHKLVIVPAASAVPEYIPVTTAQGKPASMARVLVTYTIYGPEGDYIQAVAPGEAMDSGDKAVSKAMSVAWRTALLQTFFLPTEEPDPDSEVHELGAGTIQTMPSQYQPARPYDAPAIARLEQRDRLIADWNAAIDEAVGDYQALGKLIVDARAKRAPKEILDRIIAEGNKVKP